MRRPTFGVLLGWVFALVVMLTCSAVFAQTQVQPFYQVGSSQASGMQQVRTAKGLPVGAIVVAACGTAPSTYTAAQSFTMTMDVNGNLCIAGTITAAQTAATTTMATAAPTAATFSALLASSASRKACLIQNTGSTTGYIYFGATGSATTGNSFTLAAGQSISCTNNNVTLTDNVAGTCASGTCAFVISSQ